MPDNLARIKSIIASQALRESGLLSDLVFQRAEAILSGLQPRERFALMTAVTREGVLATAATQSDDGRFRLAAWLKTDGLVWRPGDSVDAGLMLRLAF